MSCKFWDTKFLLLRSTWLKKNRKIVWHFLLNVLGALKRVKTVRLFFMFYTIWYSVFHKCVFVSREGMDFIYLSQVGLSLLRISFTIIYGNNSASPLPTFPEWTISICSLPYFPKSWIYLFIQPCLTKTSDFLTILTLLRKTLKGDAPKHAKKALQASQLLLIKIIWLLIIALHYS